jgi:monothiol glutaredoxin
MPYKHGFHSQSGQSDPMSDVQQRIDEMVKGNRVMLFMKGTAQFPMCGFSGRAIQVLKASGATEIKTFNVLEDEEVRQGIKDYAQWPTIPQLYINGEFVGGSDIMMEMYESASCSSCWPRADVVAAAAPTRLVVGITGATGAVYGVRCWSARATWACRRTWWSRRPACSTRTTNWAWTAARWRHWPTTPTRRVTSAPAWPAAASAPRRWWWRRAR